jgi:hypothetical protein
MSAPRDNAPSVGGLRREAGRLGGASGSRREDESPENIAGRAVVRCQMRASESLFEEDDDAIVGVYVQGSVVYLGTTGSLPSGAAQR